MDITRISLGADFHNREVSSEEMRLLLCAKNSGKQREEEIAIITKSSKEWMIRTTPYHLPRFYSSLFSLPDQHTINFAIPIFKTFNSKPNFPSSQPPRHPHPHTPRPPPGTPSPSALVVETDTCASRTLAQRIPPRNLSTSPSPFSSSFVHLPLGDAEISAGPPVSPYSSFPLPQRHCLSFVPLRPTGHHHRRVRCVQR